LGTVMGRGPVEVWTLRLRWLASLVVWRKERDALRHVVGSFSWA
jgi:hypothetical protein